MVARRWVDNAQYYEYAPLTLEYYPRLDGYTIARADVYAGEGGYHLAILVIVIERRAIGDPPSLTNAITRGRALLNRLVEEYRGGAEHLTNNVTLIFDLDGRFLP